MPPALARALPILPMFRHNLLLNVNLTMGLMCAIYLLLMLDDWRKAGRVYSPYPVAFVLTAFAGISANFARHWGWWPWMSDAIRQS